MGNGMALPTFFRANAAKGPRGIHEANHGTAEFFRLFHQTQGFAIAFRVGRAEIPTDPFFCRPPLFNADDGDGAALQERHAAHDGGVVGKSPVAVQFEEIGENVLNIGEAGGAVI